MPLGLSFPLWRTLTKWTAAATAMWAATAAGALPPDVNEGVPVIPASMLRLRGERRDDHAVVRRCFIGEDLAAHRGMGHGTGQHQRLPQAVNGGVLYLFLGQRDQPAGVVVLQRGDHLGVNLGRVRVEAVRPALLVGVGPVT